MAVDIEHRRVLTVGALTLLIQDTLEGAFPAVWVSGEISDLARPRSGHVYFTLKDADAQIKCVMWRSTALRLTWEPQDGMQIACLGELTVYPPRGAYQLSLRQIEPMGLGALEQALRQLQRKLAAEGLFAEARKRPLPRFPSRIAVITSPTGAAVRDFLQVLSRRWPAQVIVIPTRVQGVGAAQEIVRALGRAANLRPPPDVLVLTRGGGSLEDLWAFNEEAVVRAVAAAPVPVVSAIGHEIDVTLCDLAADLRALTPSEAAERVVPSRQETRQGLIQYQTRLAHALRARAGAARAKLQELRNRRVLARPLERLLESERRLDELEVRLQRAVHWRSQQAANSLEALAARLQSLNPMNVLARGYTLTLDHAGNVIAQAQDLHPGDMITTRFSQGQVRSLVRVVQADAANAENRIAGDPN